MFLAPEAPRAAPTADDHVIGDHVIGDWGAPVTAVLYGDYEDASTRDVYSLLTPCAGGGGRPVRVVYRHLPDVDRHPHAYTAALAAETAGSQGSFGRMHALLMDQPRGLGRDALLDYASDLDLDVMRFELELRTRLCTGRIWKHIQRAEADGVDTPPGVFLDGRRIVAAPGPSSLVGALTRALDGLNGRSRRQLR